MSAGSVLFRAAVQWHKAGMVTSPNAPSVKLTGIFVEELLLARDLIGVLSWQDFSKIRQEDFEAWAMRAGQLKLRTDEVETLRGG
jgi:hypothetical protein